ncbi:serine-threonine protein phosphatase [Vibrio astriarenae]|nr:serine-threonine protein phosphatase [Vibrio sp. C7]
MTSGTTIAADEAPSDKVDSLVDYNWKNRIFLIQEPASSAKVIQALTDDSKAVDERDVIWFVVGKDSIASNQAGPLSDSLKSQVKSSFTNRSRQTILIGKDGGIKSRTDEFDLDQLYKQIDAMPMRKREIEKERRH